MHPLTLYQCISYSFAALVSNDMLLLKHKKKGVKGFSVLLITLCFFFAVGWLFFTKFQDRGSFLSHNNTCTNTFSSEHREQLSPLVTHAQQKISHHRIRHKQLKSFLKRTKENSVSSARLCWNIVPNFLPRSDTLIRPGYYLFLFRLMLF